MRAAINCALANRQILTHLTRRAFAEIFPHADLRLIYDVSHNTCKLEQHEVAGKKRWLFVHRKSAPRAYGPGHPDLPAAFRDVGQPVLIGGTAASVSRVTVSTFFSRCRLYSTACICSPSRARSSGVSSSLTFTKR